MKKKIILGIATAGTALAMLPMFAAFEAHVINVTATIENALSVPTELIAFGTVFPQEKLAQNLSITLSQSFIDDDDADQVEYFIRQKPKCAVTNEAGTAITSPTWTGHIVLGDNPATANATETSYIDCNQDIPENLDITPGANAEQYLLPDLCPYISKHGNEAVDVPSPTAETNDGNLPSFHLPWAIVTVAGDNPHTVAVEADLVAFPLGKLIWNDTPGLLDDDTDTADIWVIDLAVPCFGGNCAQDWDDFVHGINPDANPDNFTADIDDEHKVFGCNLWVEVSGVNRDDEVQRPTVGALSSSYNDPAPEACNFTVGAVVAGPITHTTIQGAINAAVDTNTVCVDPTYAGTDTFPVNVDKDLTIAGLGAMGDANVPGGFFISDSGVTITGLEFTNYSFIQASENAAIYIHNEIGVSGVALASTLIDHNIFTAPAGAKAALAKGIVTEIGSAAAVQATGIDVLHNVFNGWRQAMFFNTTDDYEVAFNDILNNDVGVANDGPHNASIHNNDFEGNVLEAVGVAPSATNGTGNNGILTVNTNNLTPAGAGNDVNWYGSSVIVGFDVNAQDNFWAGEAAGVRTNDITEVDTSSEEAVAYPEN